MIVLARLYIYRIINKVTKQLYVGQSSAQGDLTRVFDHFNYENEPDSSKEFFRSCLAEGLCNVEIQIFDERNDYGYPKYMFENFFSMWRPGDKAVRNVDESSELLKASTLKIRQPYTDKFYNKLQILDAAEILHILNAESETGCKLINAEMGGQTTAWYFAKGGSKTRQLARTDTPAEARRVISSCHDDLVWMQNEADRIIRGQFYSTECIEELSNLITNSVYDSFQNYLTDGKLNFAKLFNAEKIWKSIKNIVLQEM